MIETMNEHRLNAIEENIEWLRNADLEDRETRVEALQRLGLMKGDVRVLIQEVSL